MEQGVIRQVGKPQLVYDEPENLFVSKFLGTPPINVFQGRVEREHLYIGTEDVMDAFGVTDGPITVGVRPEGFVPAADGALTCELIAVERMGRDTSVVAKHPALEGVQIRAIVSSDARIDTKSSRVRFNLRPEKTRLFDAETGERVHFFGETMEEPAEVMAREARANESAATEAGAAS